MFVHEFLQDGHWVSPDGLVYEIFGGKPTAVAFLDKRFALQDRVTLTGLVNPLFMKGQTGVIVGFEVVDGSTIPCVKVLVSDAVHDLYTFKIEEIDLVRHSKVDNVQAIH